MLGLLLAVGLARADGYYVESAPILERDAANAVQEKARAAGLDGRIVRRFRLGHGWEFVLLVEDIPSEAEATAAATKLADAVDLKVTVFFEESGAKAVPVAAPPAVTEAPAMTAAQWLARVDAAMGGATGGASELARAGAVHFVFARSFKLDGREVTMRHDYWREGGHRRLSVATGGAGKDSVAYVTPTGAWILADGATKSRDIGVAVGAVDEFAPEAVLTIALESHALLRGKEAQRFQVLEGAESGLRLGVGADAPDSGLTYLDIDPATARPVRARYVTEAGPAEWELGDWRQIGAGVVVPFSVRIVRADGSTEKIKVERLDVAEGAPAGTFTVPGG